MSLVMILAAACGASPTTATSPAVTVVLSQTVVPTPMATTPAATAIQTPAPTMLPQQVTPTVAPAAPSPTPRSGTVGLRTVVDIDESLTYLTYAGDNATRLYLVTKVGRVLVLEGGTVRAQPFLDITDRVGSDASERGLLSIAFSPHYASDGAFYAYYTNLHGDVVVSRFSAARDTAQADLASEQILLTVGKHYPNHNGGQLQFGPDGMLYIGIGDGGSQGDPNGNGQNTQALLGKLLRIDVSTAGQPYTSPPDNPLQGKGGRAEIWAYGLRNPWRFSFDRATGDLYIADVGQDTYEEIDYQPAGDKGGQNYGWNLYEGFEPYKSEGSAVGLTMPVYAYSHQLGCSITGGYVYRGKSIPALTGTYLYSDYCTGHLWSLQRGSDGTWHNTLLAELGQGISSFGEDAAGELYVVVLRGVIYQITP
jgi:glucose/arabinose dehydrogenase